MANVEMHDLLILGGGIAGWAAAGFAARTGRRVGVVTRHAEPVPASFWLHSKLPPIFNEIDVNLDKLKPSPFTGITFWSNDLSRHVECKEPAGMMLIERTPLRDALRGAALKAGAVELPARTIAGVDAREESVRLRAAEGPPIEGRLLIAADGMASLVVRTMRLTPAESTGYCCAQWRGPAAKKTRGARGTTAAVHLVMATQGPLGFAAIIQSEHGATLRLSEPGDAADVANRMQAMHTRLASRPEFAALQAKPVQVDTHAVPRGAALDFDTHVSKRTLVIGEAGGFVSALSQDGLYPAILSAKIAVDVAHRALNDKHVQDGLGAFDARWRAELADILRLPGTDLKFLLPLVFTNPAIAERMAKAFLLGENM